MSTLNANLFQHINIPARDSPYGGSPFRQVTVLPLNLIALIISHLDHVADLARVCRTSRVLHYMTLPQLYKSITLISYNTIRYKNDQPEGQGSASPFSMGLNGLVTRNISSLVTSLSLEGEWREHDLQEFARVGRVPDDSMMLNIAVRAAVDKCIQLESFKWDLSTKLLETVYHGLAGLPKLKSLHLRCPATRLPRPSITLPPIPNLAKLVLTHYDPLCYPDDVSTLLLHAQSLETLAIHFSPRMRDAREPSVQFSSFVRKNIALQRPLKLKTLQVYNLFALANSTEIGQGIDPSGVVNVTFLNTFGQDEDILQNHSNSTGIGGGYCAFIDRSWEVEPKNLNPRVESERYDRLSKRHATSLSTRSGLQRLYMINSRHNGSSSGTPNGLNYSDPSPSSAASGSPPSLPSNRPTPPSNTSLRDMYISAICTHHGSTLKHLIFPSRWPLTPKVFSQLIRSCPHLTQLSMGMDVSVFPQLRLLVPFLKNLWAIRMALPETGASRIVGEVEMAMHEGVMSQEMATEGDFPELRFVGLGQWVWEVGGIYEEEDGEGGEIIRRRRLKRITLEEVKDVEIWRMDSQDVVV